MNKQELVKSISEMEAKLADMKQQLVQMDEPKYYMPLVGESYFCINVVGEVQCLTWSGSVFCENIWLSGNIYATEQEAERASNKRKAYVKVVRALRDHEGDFIADWDNTDQQKFRIIQGEYGFGTSYNTSITETFKELYSSKESCEWVIDNMEAELKLMFD